LLVLILVICCAIYGLSYGIKLGSSYGILGKIIGGFVGPILGVAAALLLTALLILIYAPFDIFVQWWRPYPPCCENGTCRGWDSYTSRATPQELLWTEKGLSSTCWRCNCGNMYAGGYGCGMRNRWVRVLPDAQVRPYLRHRSFGPWLPDDGAGMGTPDRMDKIERALGRWNHVQIPGWVIPIATSSLMVAIAAIVVYSEDRFTNPIAPWLVAAVGILGLLLGAGVSWLGPRWFK
jgi:hypothetical protein